MAEKYTCTDCGHHVAWHSPDNDGCGRMAHGWCPCTTVFGEDVIDAALVSEQEDRVRDAERRLLAATIDLGAAIAAEDDAHRSGLNREATADRYYAIATEAYMARRLVNDLRQELATMVEDLSEARERAQDHADRR